MSITKIYLVENCYGDPNKVYIGKEKNEKYRGRCREQDHKKTYGQDIIFTYIDQVDSLNKQDWEPLETFWIEYFRQLGFDLQNKRMKGGGGPEFCSEETKLKLSKINKGRKFTEEQKEKLRFPRPNSGPKGKRPESFSQKISKPITQYDLEGNFIKDWKNVVEIKKMLGFHPTTIRKCCNKDQITAYGFMWRYKSENELKPKLINRKTRNYHFPEKIIKERKNNKRLTKSILQYNLDGNFIKEWNSLTEAAESVGRIDPSYISMCCRNKIRQAYNYIWKFKDDK